MKLVIGCDHAGFATKEYLIKKLATAGHTILDVGTFSEKSVDYPTIAKDVAQHVKGRTKGILVCGSGTGMVIAANKTKGVRAAMAYDTYSAEMARKDNDANVICLRGRGVSKHKNLSLVNTFLATKFTAAARHKRRVKQLNSL
ncbi:MAG: RpiB/LacA/LacB family sugar-phosphate isomerase [Candidatus Woesearchaeota archaeon]|nr:RpiB/LacA/LacB family sugar-phosphate isomerase [Candidatus Woesearchaeota archaeon]